MFSKFFQGRYPICNYNWHDFLTQSLEVWQKRITFTLSHTCLTFPCIEIAALNGNKVEERGSWETVLDCPSPPPIVVLLCRRLWQTASSTNLPQSFVYVSKESSLAYELQGERTLWPAHSISTKNKMYVTTTRHSRRQMQWSNESGQPQQLRYLCHATRMGANAFLLSKLVVQLMSLRCYRPSF